MNWLRRLLGYSTANLDDSAPARPVLVLGTHLPLPVTCIDCKGDQPVFVMLDLRTVSIQNGRVTDEITGRRVSCQQCGSVYSIGPHGIFRQSRKALPYGPGRPTESEEARTQPAPEDISPPDGPSRHIRIPRERPNV